MALNTGGINPAEMIFRQAARNVLPAIGRTLKGAFLGAPPQVDTSTLNFGTDQFGNLTFSPSDFSSVNRDPMRGGSRSIQTGLELVDLLKRAGVSDETLAGLGSITIENTGNAGIRLTLDNGEVIEGGDINEVVRRVNNVLDLGASDQQINQAIIGRSADRGPRASQVNIDVSDPELQDNLNTALAGINPNAPDFDAIVRQVLAASRNVLPGEIQETAISTPTTPPPALSVPAPATVPSPARAPVPIPEAVPTSPSFEPIDVNNLPPVSDALLAEQLPPVLPVMERPPQVAPAPIEAPVPGPTTPPQVPQPGDITVPSSGTGIDPALLAFLGLGGAATGIALAGGGSGAITQPTPTPTPGPTPPPPEAQLAQLDVDGLGPEPTPEGDGTPVGGITDLQRIQALLAGAGLLFGGAGVVGAGRPNTIAGTNVAPLPVPQRTPEDIEAENLAIVDNLNNILAGSSNLRLPALGDIVPTVRPNQVSLPQLAAPVAAPAPVLPFPPQLPQLPQPIFGS